MQVLHINQSDIVGGAGIAAWRLHCALPAQNVRSRMLVDIRKSGSDLVDLLPPPGITGKLRGRITQRLGFNFIGNNKTIDIVRNRHYRSADVLNLHNVHMPIFNYLAIPELARKKPVVFTLHDMWAFTGHCAYSFHCERWKTGCGACPQLQIQFEVPRDNTAMEWRLKQRAYNQCPVMAVVCPSKWLAEQARSSLLGSHQVYHIPNGLDTSIYRPLDKQKCRDLLGIPGSRTVILLAAQSISDPRKQASVLLDALSKSPSKLRDACFFIVMGEEAGDVQRLSGIDAMPLGFIGGDRMKAVAFNAADLCAFPTTADNLPLVLQESISCGVPMVSFDVGGVKDLVRHMETGYLAKAGDMTDFLAGLRLLVEDVPLRMRLSERCRDIAVAEYGEALQARRYAELYAAVVDEFRSAVPSCRAE